MSGLPRPGKALIGLMIVITTLWLTFAIGLNWGGASEAVFYLLAGNTDAILRGQVWRLFTAPLLHAPQGGYGVLNLLLPLLGLSLLAPRLEEVWGSARMLRFIALTSVLSYALQAAVGLLLPSALAERLVGTYWFGLGPALTAISIAWACMFKGAVVNLIILPVSTRTLIWITIGLACLGLATGEASGQGLLAPFFGILFGWLFGGGTPSPLRKAWLKLRLAQLEGQDARQRGAPRKARPNPGGLRVIPGGRADDDDKGPDGRWLN